MTCDSCIFTITKALSSKPGVSKVHIDLQSKLASIVYDSRLTASDFIIEHIHGLNEGFTASEAHSQAQIFHVQGLNCGNCVKKIEGSLDNVTVNLPQAKAYCLKNSKDALKSIQNLGFKVLPLAAYQERDSVQRFLADDRTHSNAKQYSKYKLVSSGHDNSWLGVLREIDAWMTACSQY